MKSTEFTLRRFVNRNGVTSWRVTGWIDGVRIRKNFKTGGQLPREPRPTVMNSPAPHSVVVEINRLYDEAQRLLEYYQGLPNEQLIRKLILGKMQRAGYANQRNQEIIAWVEEHPEIKAKIEARVKNVPEANRQRAFLTAAKTEAMNQTVKPAQGVRV